MRDAVGRLGAHGSVAALVAALAIVAGPGIGSTLTAASNAPVADAAMRGDVEAVRAALRSGGSGGPDGGAADVNAPQGDGMTALHWAARHGSVEMVALLLDAGADPTATTRLGAHTPLHVASTSGHDAAVRALLDGGADAGALTTTGAAPLHFAAAAGRAEAVRLLIDRGADANVREPQWGQTPLMFAAAQGRAAAVRVLLDAGADPAVTATVVDITERNRQDAADSRARRARVAEVRKALVREAAGLPEQQEEKQPEGEEAAGAAPTPPAGPGSPAAEPSLEEEREVDLQEEPEPLRYHDLVGTHGGLTALLLAAREGEIETVLTLIDGGAGIDQPSAADGTTPLLMATINGHFDLARMLVERGADVTLASDAGATPLYAALNMHWAPKSRHPQPTDYMQQRTSYMDLMRLFIARGADVNARLTRSLWYTTYNRDLLGVDRTGATPFWRAAYALDLDAMKLLLDHGADPDIPTIKVPERRRGDDTDHSGLPPVPLGGPAVYAIHAASGVGYGRGFAGNSHRHVPDAWLPTVKFLVEELGADVNQRDHHGYTPVHHAASRGDNELIRYLVSKGADVTAVARNGQTTIDVANGPVQRVQPFPETIEYLASLGATNNNRCVSC